MDEIDYTSIKHNGNCTGCGLPWNFCMCDTSGPDWHPHGYLPPPTTPEEIANEADFIRRIQAGRSVFEAWSGEIEFDDMGE